MCYDRQTTNTIRDSDLWCDGCGEGTCSRIVEALPVVLYSVYMISQQPGRLPSRLSCRVFVFWSLHCRYRESTESYIYWQNLFMIFLILARIYSYQTTRDRSVIQVYVHTIYFQTTNGWNNSRLVSFTFAIKLHISETKTNIIVRHNRNMSKIIFFLVYVN